ncbi:MAG: hypothetical protein ACHQ49_13980 [Elusimicrobiota bacterium]
MTLLALLAVLTVAPAAAAPVKIKPASCLHPASGPPPASLEDLQACQNRTRAAVVNAAQSQGAPLTNAQLDKLDDYQRAEARKFFASPAIVAKGGPEPVTDAAASPQASTNKLGGATPSDLAHTDAKTASSISDLQARLQAAAGDGSNGITPAMGADILATLTQAQGGLSPDMKALLDGVTRDGGKLTPETMTKLQGAAAAAKADGLDLNIDQGIEKDLLRSDFSKDKTAAPAGF